MKIDHNFSIQSLFTSSLCSHIVHSAQCIHSTSLQVCTMTMKVSFANANNNGSNGRNAFAKNLLVPILFYPKVDGSVGSDDEKPSS